MKRKTKFGIVSTYTQKYCAIVCLPTPVMDGWSSRLFVCEDVYLMLQSDNRQSSFLWISNLLDISDYPTDAPHQVSSVTKSTMCDWKSMFEWLPTETKTWGPSIASLLLSPFPGSHKADVPFKRYMSLAGRMNGTAWVNKFEARHRGPSESFIRNDHYGPWCTWKMYEMWSEGWGKYEDWLPDPPFNG